MAKKHLDIGGILLIFGGLMNERAHGAFQAIYLPCANTSAVTSHKNYQLWEGVAPPEGYYLVGQVATALRDTPHVHAKDDNHLRTVAVTGTEGVDITAPATFKRLFQDQSLVHFYRMVCPPGFHGLGDIGKKTSFPSKKKYRCVHESLVVKADVGHKICDIRKFRSQTPTLHAVGMSHLHDHDHTWNSTSYYVITNNDESSRFYTLRQEPLLASSKVGQPDELSPLPVAAVGGVILLLLCIVLVVFSLRARRLHKEQSKAKFAEDGISSTQTAASTYGATCESSVVSTASSEQPTQDADNTLYARINADNGAPSPGADAAIHSPHYENIPDLPVPPPVVVVQTYQLSEVDEAAAESRRYENLLEVPSRLAPVSVACSCRSPRSPLDSSDDVTQVYSHAVHCSLKDRGSSLVGANVYEELYLSDNDDRPVFDAISESSATYEFAVDVAATTTPS